MTWLAGRPARADRYDRRRVATAGAGLAGPANVWWHARALDAAENQQHLPLLAFACNAQGLTLRRRGRLDEAARWHRRALSICHERGVPAAEAMASASVGYVAELQNDVAAAERHHRLSLNVACEATDRQAVALALEGLAGAASLRGDPQATGKLLGAAAALRKGSVVNAVGAATAQRGIAVGYLDQIDIDRAIARVSGSAYDSAFAAGLRDPRAVLDAARA
jgi:hypothetical protein